MINVSKLILAYDTNIFHVVIMDKFSLTFATKGNFPPILAAWMPNIIFIFIGLWLYRKAPK